MPFGRLLTVFVPLLMICAPGCSQEDIQRLGRVGETTASRLQDLSAGARSRVAQGIESLTSREMPPLARRTTIRLQADQQLAGITIVVIANGSQIELKGSVKDQAQKERALDLARTTLGVEKVIDGLSVGGS